MVQTLGSILMELPSWLEIVESGDGTYQVLDTSFDDGAMELARFGSADGALQFAMRLAERRAGLLLQR